MWKLKKVNYEPQTLQKAEMRNHYAIANYITTIRKRKTTTIEFNIRNLVMGAPTGPTHIVIRNQL